MKLWLASSLILMFASPDTSAPSGGMEESFAEGLLCCIIGTFLLNPLIMQQSCHKKGLSFGSVGGAGSTACNQRASNDGTFCASGSQHVLQAERASSTSPRRHRSSKCSSAALVAGDCTHGASRHDEDRTPSRGRAVASWRSAFNFGVN